MFILSTYWCFKDWDLIAQCIQRRNVFYKQREARFFSTLAYCLGEQIAFLPSMILVGAIWCPATFFMVGLPAEAFGTFLGYYFATSLCFQNFLKWITAIQDTHPGAEGVAMYFKKS